MRVPLLVSFGVCFLVSASTAEPFKITVRDSENGWPVPMVELRTTHNVSFYSDNAGVVAVDLPELMGVETWFTVIADGYEKKADGFGMRGFRVLIDEGGTFEVELERTIVAKRLGRITGAGIFGESQQVGEHLEWKESGIFGSDSVQNAVYRGRMFWAWGDTNLAKYPLGLFHMTSATTPVQPLDTFKPPLQLQLNYFRNEEEEVRNVANVAPDDPGPTWVSGYVSLQDHSGEERLVGCYSKIKPPLSSYRTGLCVWNDITENFESLQILWEESSGEEVPELLPVGHPVFWTDKEGVEWLLFGDPFPSIRMPASFEDWKNPETWSPIPAPEPPKSPEGEPVKPHRGSIAWNEFRNCWVAIFCEMEGDPSPLGEIWYAEADSPFGPWGTAVKVLSHQNYTFYNPRIHPEFVENADPILLFEGTYSQMFSNAPTPTPRSNYNQILYRLDLDDPRLAPAQGEN